MKSFLLQSLFGTGAKTLLMHPLSRKGLPPSWQLNCCVDAPNQVASFTAVRKKFMADFGTPKTHLLSCHMLTKDQPCRSAEIDCVTPNDDVAPHTSMVPSIDLTFEAAGVLLPVQSAPIVEEVASCFNN